MYLNYANVLVDVNSDEKWYIIFLDNGFKFEYVQYAKGEKPYGCPDEIDEHDVIRAKENDGLDISHLQGKKFADDEIQKNIKRAEEFLMSSNYPFGKVKIALENVK